jgi:dihydrolipoamide dehydrogenase
LSDYDVIVLGSGPGGYVAAIRCAQLGMRTAIVERDELGGVCLNWGCIPSKSLIRNAEVLNLIKDADIYGISFDNLKFDFQHAQERSRQVVNRLTTGVGFLMRKNSVEHITGEASFVNSQTIEIKPNSGDPIKTVTADRVIIATGARQKDLPTLPIDHDVVITSRNALEMSEVPNEVIIVGGGATGVEFAYVWNSYGTKVTILELMDRLVPNEDEEISHLLEKSLQSQGIEFRTGVTVEGIDVAMGSANVMIVDDGNTETISAEKVLVAVGVQGNSDNIGLQNTGVATDRGFISIGENMETNVSGIFAVGDVTGRMLLAHVASAQAVTVAEYIAGLDPQPLDYSLMPRAIYCKPQVASFGLTEAQAIEQGLSVNIGRFPFTASGKAIALGETEGMVKLVVDDEIGEIIGAHMIGSEVTELLGELSMAKLLEGTSTELGWLVRPHPTISEIVKEAALDTMGEAIHI